MCQTSTGKDIFPFLSNEATLPLSPEPIHYLLRKFPASPKLLAAATFLPPVFGRSVVAFPLHPFGWASGDWLGPSPLPSATGWARSVLRLIDLAADSLLLI